MSDTRIRRVSDGAYLVIRRDYDSVALVWEGDPPVCWPRWYADAVFQALITLGIYGGYGGNVEVVTDTQEAHNDGHE